MASSKYRCFQFWDIHRGVLRTIPPHTPCSTRCEKVWSEAFFHFSADTTAMTQVSEGSITR